MQVAIFPPRFPVLGQPAPGVTIGGHPFSIVWVPVGGFRGPSVVWQSRNVACPAFFVFVDCGYEMDVCHRTRLTPIEQHVPLSDLVRIEEVIVANYSEYCFIATSGALIIL